MASALLLLRQGQDKMPSRDEINTSSAVICDALVEIVDLLNQRNLVPTYLKGSEHTQALRKIRVIDDKIRTLRKRIEKTPIYKHTKPEFQEKIKDLKKMLSTWGTFPFNNIDSASNVENMIHRLKIEVRPAYV